MVTEESVKETVKTIAQGMPDDCGVPLVADACAFLLHRRPRVQRASGIPCALFVFEGGLFPIARTFRAARTWTCVFLRSHAPRMRGIQYAAASRLKHNRLWNTGSSGHPRSGRGQAPDDDDRESGCDVEESCLK